MGAVIAQQLATDGLARALVLVCSAARSGILPTVESEKRASHGLMSLGPFWTSAVHPNFEVAVNDSLNRVPQAEQRAIFDRFGPEFGRALFELFFWMFDPTGATHVELDRIRCPVLCVFGSEDQLVSSATARATVAGLKHASLLEARGCGHTLPLEPNSETIAGEIAAWIMAHAA
jgi:pimeloyl-ACP methyl ester carboxylesterase